MFMMLIFPTFIQPLFNKFESLPEGTLRVKIEALAKRLNFPLTQVFVMDGSKRSSHSNAYFFGFFTKRIVLFDTLIQQNSEDEICAVLGHELGHWKCWHQFQMLFVTQLHIFVLFYAFSHFINRSEIYEAFGFRDEMPVIIGLMLFGGFIAPSEILLSFLMNLFSRKNEFEADRFAVKLGYGDLLQSALINLQIENKSNMNPDWMYSAMNYSHPPLLERLEAIKSAMDKQK
jgi:STE24 endopeptidase